jgi:hypothetical protein
MTAESKPAARAPVAVDRSADRSIGAFVPGRRIAQLHDGPAVGRASPRIVTSVNGTSHATSRRGRHARSDSSPSRRDPSADHDSALRPTRLCALCNPRPQGPAAGHFPLCHVRRGERAGFLSAGELAGSSLTLSHAYCGCQLLASQGVAERRHRGRLRHFTQRDVQQTVTGSRALASPVTRPPRRWPWRRSPHAAALSGRCQETRWKRS